MTEIVQNSQSALKTYANRVPTCFFEFGGQMGSNRLKWCQICHILLKRKCLGSQFEHEWLSRTKAVVKTVPAPLYMLFQNWGSNSEKSQNRGSNIRLRLKCAKYQPSLILRYKFQSTRSMKKPTKKE